MTTQTKLKPRLRDARILIKELLESDANYRRELGAFGADDRRTKQRAHMLSCTIRTMRAWYNSRYQRKDGEQR